MGIQDLEIFRQSVFFNSFRTSKTTLSFFLLISIIVILFLSDAKAQWEQTNGPDCESIFCTAISGTNIFAGTQTGGVFLSSNNGLNWMPVNEGLTNLDVRSLIFLGTRLFAGTYGDGVFISTNNGTNWIQTSLNYEGIYSLAVSGTTLFAGSYYGVYISTNYGANWTQINTGLPYAPIVNSLLISGEYIFAGTTRGVFRSSNNGAVWDTASTGITSQYVYSLCIYGGNIYAATSNGVNYSSNNGNNWNFKGLKNKTVKSITTSGTNLTAGMGNFSGGVYNYTNADTNWTQTSLTFPSVYFVKSNGSDIITGTNTGLFITSNNGVNWNNRNDGLPMIHSTIFGLTTIGQSLFAATQDFGIFMSSNNGVNWNPVSNGIRGDFMKSITSSGSILLAGGVLSGIYFSSNNGSNWNWAGLSNKNIRSVFISGSNFFAGTFSQGVFKSTNSGTNWTNIGLTGNMVTDFALIGNNLFASIYGEGVYRSTNDGLNWVTVNYGLSNICVNTLAVSGTTLFAGTDEGGVYKSTDNGLNWTAHNNNLNNSNVNTLKVYGSNIFAGMNGGVYMSSVNTSNWINKNLGFGSNPLTINSIHISNNYIFAGTYQQSVWRRSISEIIGIQNISTELPTSYSLKQNYPNPFNPTTSIKFEIPKSSNVKILVYDNSGKEIDIIVNEKLNAGIYQIGWNGTHYSSGVYFYKIIAGDFTETRKMIMLK